ncbi:MAG: type I-MYXAN CRISPR-associated protein Cas6/Cmx6 [Pseudomonadota bacterium]|nr:type I-MYXAN CRISPR-associated protein Cas6/Cmx6 [Pseudomonadota bacterium]
MYWTENADKENALKIPDDVVDLSFKLDCKCLANDNVWELSQAIKGILPWLADEPHAGIHQIHGAESMNGWNRPEEADSLIHLSRRTRLYLRVPGLRVKDALKLEGKTLDIAGMHLIIGKSSVKLLSLYEVQFSRFIISRPEENEDEFLQAAVEELRKLNIPPRKLLSGKAQSFRTPEGDITTRSLMVADLEPMEAIRLQEAGIGEGRLLGCGLFVPHKGIKHAKES